MSNAIGFEVDDLDVETLATWGRGNQQLINRSRQNTQRTAQTKSEFTP